MGIKPGKVSIKYQSTIFITVKRNNYLIMKNILLLGTLLMFAFNVSAQSDVPPPPTADKTKTEKACCAKKADGEKVACTSEKKAACSGKKEGAKACCAKSADGSKKTCSAEEKAACSGKKDGAKSCCAKTADGSKKTCSSEEKAACCSKSTADKSSNSKSKEKGKKKKSAATTVVISE